MTFINRLVVQGFKSFNKKIALPLSSGFMVICGPNGSGKSNILDAICFVLGRTSAKSLRADRLHELIFHGGDSKKPSDYASVIMYLDNANKIFPFEDPEVSVTRKVNRKGVSIYKIQGKTTTREKVVELLANARIHPDGHNLVLQGDITNIIEMNAVERRFIIDEISGIAEYNDKKEKAKKDLEAVDVKLKEAEIVINERYDIFKKLEDERNAALKFQSLQKQLQVMKASLSYRKLSNFQDNTKALDESIAKKEAENEKLQKEVEKVEEELERREKGIEQLAGKIIGISKRLETEKEISYLRTKIMINKDKIDSNRKEIERLDSLISKLTDIETSKVEEVGGIPRAVRTVLEMKLKGVHGIFRSLIKVPEKYQTAVEIAAGHHMNDVVVDNDEIAAECIDFLKREKIGRVTFIPLNKIRSKTFDEKISGKGVVDVASQLVKCEQKFKPALDFVLGSTLVVDSLETSRAIGIGKVRMVTLEGDLVEKSGVMVGGYLIRRPQLMQKMTKDEIEEYRKLKEKLEQEIKDLARQIEEFGGKLKEYSKSEENREFIDLEKLKVDSEVELDKLRQNRKEFYERRLMVQTDLNRMKVQKAKTDAELENVKIEVEQYGEVEYLSQGIKSLENGIEQATKELATIGAVNFKSIEQYDNFKTEFDEYKKKYEKIFEEKKAVLGMMEKIEQKRRDVFYKCMQELSQKFDDLFKRMTGGSASLSLENVMDLESGLVIQANPGGKMLLNIDSMSGGEKTLTALAFLFAVQEYRPSPFYILDEVDAALDKENSKKVADLVKMMSRKAQFIVITHNDMTIRYGDRIYGVTMEAGESKILGLEMPQK